MFVPPVKYSFYKCYSCLEKSQDGPTRGSSLESPMAVQALAVVHDGSSKLSYWLFGDRSVNTQICLENRAIVLSLRLMQ
jgi:hypothetical protein